MNSETFYFGAFLYATDAYEDFPITVPMCKNGHKYNTKFCPVCGEPIIKHNTTERRKKDFYGSNMKWVDEMVYCYVENLREEHIIFIPNHGNAGKVGESTAYDISPADIDFYKNRLKERYSDYIKWLVEERKFNISVRFGAFTYYN
jgi:hypothetical protein